MHWDTAEIRRERESGWFREHEAEMLEAARQKRAAAEKHRRSAEAEQRRLAHWKRCPKCGDQMTTLAIDGVEVEKCPSCEGIFLDRGELDRLLLNHDAHRRGFFRKLLGFHEP